MAPRIQSSVNSVLRTIAMLAVLASAPAAAALPAGLEPGARPAGPGLSARPAPADSAALVSLAPGPEHGAGTVRRLLYGRRYSELWTTPVRAEVLNMGSASGGLKPVTDGPGAH